MVGFLYGQTEYSIGENTICLESYFEKAVSEGFSFLSITDANLFGSFKFYQACKERNIKPIIGLKVKINSLIDRDNYILLYAKTHEGLVNLFKISSCQLDQGIVSDEFISEHRKGLILVTASSDSNLDYFLFKQDSEIIEKEFNRLKNMSDELYYGVMPQSYIYDMIIDDVKDFSLNNKIKTLPLAKCSYIDNKDSLEGLSKIFGINVDLEEDLSFKTADKLKELFIDEEGIFDNLEQFVNSIDEDIYKFDHQLPTFKNSKTISSIDYLKTLANKGLEKRLANSNIIDDGKYQTRLEYEISVIEKMGYVDYFLIVFEFVSYAKRNGILVGPGRGSAAGSLVSYVLGISEIDPIKYDLLFERFLNPERVTMPDIDIDFPDDRRADVINHVKDIYGADHVASIMTFTSYSFKTALADLLNVYKIDDKYKANLDEMYKQDKSDDEVKEAFSLHPEITKLIDIAKCLEGLPKNTSTHTSGYVLTNSSLFDCVPVKMINDIYQAQLESTDLEKLGLLKIDFLSVSDLSLFDSILKQINKTDHLELKDIPLDDKKTYELLSNGDTAGIFQFNSGSFTKYLKMMKPSCFEDIVAIHALNRPGPVDFIPLYIERKNGASFEYIHPDLEEILKDTYGIIVYQEQIMKIAQKVCGYSLGEADILRRAIAKKKREVLESERVNFVTRAIDHGYDEKIANEIYDYIAKFADYGFNRSHTVAYGLFSYQMSYLKANYYSIFVSEVINRIIGTDSVVKEYIEELSNKGFNVLPPEINKSTDVIVIEGNNLYLPLSQINSVTKQTATLIAKEREQGFFKDFKDLKRRTKNIIRSNILENLVKSGACDSFGTHMSMLKEASDDMGDYIPEELLNDKSTNEYSEAELQQQEYESLGFNLKYNVFAHYEELFTEFKATRPSDLVVDKKANIIGLVKRYKEIDTKNNQKMAFVTINAKGELLDAVLFSDEYEQYKNVLYEKALVLFNGTVRKRNDEVQLQIIKMRKL